MPGPLLPFVTEPADRDALSAGGRTLSYRQLRDAATSLAVRVAGMGRVAVWATPGLETCVAVVGVLLSGSAAVPLNPKIGERELAHVLSDSAPTAVVAARDAVLPGTAARLPRVAVDLDDPARSHSALPPESDDEAPAFVFYTSGTTGPPKGVPVSRRAVASNLDALAEAWAWTSEDVLTHALPLFHVHGLVLGVLGPLRTGGSLRHTGRFSPEALCRELEAGATMLFGVPTMYHALADAADAPDGGSDVARPLGRARLLVSGSAPLQARDAQRLQRATGQPVLERYGLTETLMNCAARVDSEPRPGTVGPPLAGVDVLLLDDQGNAMDESDDQTMGEVAVRGPNVFRGYLNRPDATAAVLRDGLFHTGDLATRGDDGSLRIVGRRATDLIKTGGFKVGAGEVEAALLEHVGVAEVAVTGEPDDRLGERIVAWVVAREATQPPPAKELEDHVAALLAPHKRPRVVRYLDALPRNDMGKIKKAELKVQGDGGSN
jgi:malonyl-CoA/methylmalonyl-CoA synthetase